MLKVDGGCLGGELGLNALGIHVTLAEGLKGSNGLCRIFLFSERSQIATKIIITFPQAEGRINPREVLRRVTKIGQIARIPNSGKV